MVGVGGWGEGLLCFLAGARPIFWAAPSWGVEESGFPALCGPAARRLPRCIGHKSSWLHRREASLGSSQCARAQLHGPLRVVACTLIYYAHLEACGANTCRPNLLAMGSRRAGYARIPGPFRLAANGLQLWPALLPPHHPAESWRQGSSYGSSCTLARSPATADIQKACAHCARQTGPLASLL